MLSVVSEDLEEDAKNGTSLKIFMQQKSSGWFHSLLLPIDCFSAVFTKRIIHPLIYLITLMSKTGLSLLFSPPSFLSPSHAQIKKMFLEHSKSYMGTAALFFSLW